MVVDIHRDSGDAKDTDMDIMQQINQGLVGGAVDDEAIGAIALFSHLAPETLLRLAQATHWRVYTTDAIVAGAGDEDHGVLLFVSGAMCAHFTTFGRDYIARVLAPEEVADLSDLPPLLARVLRLQAHSARTIVYWMERETFWEIVYSDPQLAQYIRKQERERFYDLAELLVDFYLHDSKHRFAHVLGRLAARFPGGHLPFTHIVLGMMAKLNRSEADRFLPEFRNERLMQYDEPGKGVTVPDPQHLREF